MREQIQEALSPLVGLPLWAANWAASMLTLQLGARRHAPTDRAPDRVVGAYGLHIQCPWRVSGRTGLVVGSDDIGLAPDPSTPEWLFDAGKVWETLAGVRMDAWIRQFAARPLVVARADVDRCGGFALQLSEGFALEVLPTASAREEDPRELWRLLRPGEESRHFVMTDSGVER